MQPGKLWRKLTMLARKRRAVEELDEEVRLHVELRAERLRETGTEPEEAPYAASRKFGNRTMIAEKSRETWSWRWLEHLGRDLRYALRALRKSPSFSLVAILSLAVALGANTAVFSFARAIVIKQLPVANAGRLVILRQHNEQFHMENCCFRYQFFQDLKKQDADFDDVLALSSTTVNLVDREQNEKIDVEMVSGNYFDMLGVRAAAGRLLDDADDASEGTGHVAVIGYRLWQERFGGRQDVVGRRVLLDKEPVQIVGVTENGFAGMSLHEPHELQVPSSMVGKLLGETRESIGWAQVVARLKPGVTMEQAAARLNVVGLAIEKASGLNFTERDTFLLKDGSQGLDSKKEQFGKPVLLLLGLVAVVLLLACANLTALLLVRSVERTSEAGVRLALGGSSGALVRHFLSESLVLAVAGGVAGWGLSRLLTRALLNLLGPQGDGLEQHVRPDATVFAFSASVTIAAGILFGLLPAWRASRCDPLNAIRGLAAAGRGGRSIASRLLIGGQIALSLALLFGAGLFMATLRNLRSIDVGFRPENVALMHVDLSDTAYARNGAPQFFEELLRRARGLPEARAASLATISLLSGAMQSIVLKVPGYIAPNRMPPVTYFTSVSGGYFRTLGIPLVAGRDFTNDDRAGAESEGVAIVNEHFARQFLGGEALGKTFAYGGGRRVRVVGAVGDARFRWLREEPQAVMYVPVTQGRFPAGAYLQLRTNGEPAAIAERLRAMVREMDPHVIPDQVTTMEMQIDRALARERLLVFLSTLMGGIAVALAAIGLYGVLSFAVARRTREIGIRMAIGAQRRRILVEFLKESAWMVAGGIALGIPLALGCGKLAASLLYGLKPQDAGTALMATALLAAVAFVAALIPAWRAARLEPMSALRWE
jgi:predicted permease